jgi:hypothetical protein
MRDWRHEMTPEEVATFERLAGPELDLFGYERRTPDSAWRKVFGLVVPSARVRLFYRKR